VKLYVNENLQPDHPLGLWHYREATPAEVLTHPAVAALVAERDRIEAHAEALASEVADACDTSSGDASICWASCKLSCPVRDYYGR